MNTSTTARIGIAGAVAGLGLAAAGMAVTHAETTDPPAASSSAGDRPGPGGPGGPGGPRGEHGGPGMEAAAIAESLGLEEDVVEQALQEVRDALRPEPPEPDGERPAPPSEAERSQQEAAFVTALAEKLGVTEDQVTTALEAAREQADADREERRAEDRGALAERLDAAVADGTLTEADKTSVLKAYDADLIGHDGPGGPGAHGRPGS
ncbi:hypothetical protein ABFT23_17490 [Nocardioides sp. C4-1]|uniref:hypothetical protein n=1 Tax=Nocardioides sp. C4-1 TaxID=3151851 RepID=UPI0032641DAC